MNLENMKKIYTNPSLNVVILDSDDIVVTSGDPLSFGSNAKVSYGADAKRRDNIWGEDE